MKKLFQVLTLLGILAYTLSAPVQARAEGGGPWPKSATCLANVC
ncbi:MAG TPA: hypothetical protein VGV15_09340 [Terriglobales bacterium]|nr:hypothetical protein [Terriglobales bacterium]